MNKQSQNGAAKYEDCVISSFEPQHATHNGRHNGMDNQAGATLQAVAEQLKKVKWYHGEISRNTAVLILQHNSKEGSYLLRKSINHSDFALSLRTSKSVTNIKLKYNEDDSTFTFGKAIFYSLEQLLHHFKSNPVIATDEGVSVKLLYPYNVEVNELADYKGIQRQAVLGEQYKSSNKEEGEINACDKTIAPKEGKLFKRGAIRKSWKERWIVVYRNHMKYFEDRIVASPKGTIDLKQASQVAEDFIDEKRNCFRLVLPKRTFYFVTHTPVECKEWIEYLQQKIDYYSELKQNES